MVDHGTIIEKGTHDELMDLKGSYYEMYQLQQLEQLVELGVTSMANEQTTETISSKEQRIVLMRLFTYLKPHKKLLFVALIFLALTVVGDMLYRI